MDPKTCIAGQYVVSYPVLNPKPDKRLRSSHWLSAAGLEQGRRLKVTTMTAEQIATFRDYDEEQAKRLLSDVERDIEISMPTGYGFANDRVHLRVMKNGDLRLSYSGADSPDRERYVRAIIAALKLAEDGEGILRQIDPHRGDWTSVLEFMLDTGITDRETMQQAHAAYLAHEIAQYEREEAERQAEEAARKEAKP